jgi:hypothetical protein
VVEWLKTMCDRICIVLGALLFVQTPLFMAQYQDQLIGHIAELEYQVDALQRTATASGKNLNQLIDKFLASSDKDVVRQGQFIKQMMERLDQLAEALSALTLSNAFNHSWVFLAHFNTTIGLSTWQNFQPGLPFTIEGGIYAAIGMGMGYLAYQAILRAILWIKSLF